MTALDLALIQDYTGGQNVPVASQAGYTVHADSAGTNLEYRPTQQTLAASGTWDREAPVLLVTGSGARSIALPLPSASSQKSVKVIDAAGTAAAGNITVTFTGATLATGTPVVSSNYGSLSFTYVGGTVWVLA